MNDITINNHIFKPYDEYYYVSEYGDVYSLYSNRILRHEITYDGHHRVQIHGKHRFVHHLVYETWIGNIPNGMQINHKDDNKDNNHYTNLYSGTQKDNVRDCIHNGHRVGNAQYIIVYDRIADDILTFSPMKDFIDYCGHSCKNGAIKRILKKKWFNERYVVLGMSK